MPKYGDIIKQAKSGKPDDQTARQPDDQVPGKPDSSDNEQRPSPQMAQPINQLSGKPDSQITRQPASQLAKPMNEPMKNLCVKVPEAWRRHWAAQAKLTGRTMTDVMVEALTQEFGLPDNQ